MQLSKENEKEIKAFYWRGTETEDGEKIEWVAARTLGCCFYTDREIALGGCAEFVETDGRTDGQTSSAGFSRLQTSGRRRLISRPDETSAVSLAMSRRNLLDLLLSERSLRLKTGGNLKFGNPVLHFSISFMYTPSMRTVRSENNCDRQPDSQPFCNGRKIKYFLYNKLKNSNEFYSSYYRLIRSNDT